MRPTISSHTSQASISSGISASRHHTQESGQYVKLAALPGAVEDEFESFHKQLTKLRDQLSLLSFKSGEYQLGDPTGIQLSATTLVLFVRRIGPIYRENIRGLFGAYGHDASSRESRFSTAKKPTTSLVQELLHFSHAITDLLVRCEEQANIGSASQYRDFMDDMKHWQSSLEDFETDFADHDLRTAQSFLYHMLADIGSKLVPLSEEVIPRVIYFDIPRIRASQAHAATHLNYASAVAGLLSGVIATMLQFSYSFPVHTGLSAAVNILWFMSLVSAVASAVTSVLGQSWSAAVLQYTQYCPSIWTSFWMEKGPILLLVHAVGSFFLGLALFTYISHQALATSIVTSAFSGIAICLFTLSVWSVLKVWNLAHFSSQILSFLPDGNILLQFRDKLLPSTPDEYHIEMEKEDTSNVDVAPSNIPATKPAYDTDVEAQVRGNNAPGAHNGSQRNKSTFLHSGQRRLPHTERKKLDIRSMDIPMTPSRARAQRSWIRCYRIVTEFLRYSHGHGSSLDSAFKTRYQLQAMVVTQSFVDASQMHSALIRKMTFSHDGRYLFTSSWDRTCLITPAEGMRLAESPKERSVIEALPGDIGPADNAEWSPDDSLVFQLRNVGGLSVCSRENTLPQKLDRARKDPQILAAAWFNGHNNVAKESDLQPTLPAILTIEGTTAYENVRQQDGSWKKDRPFSIKDFIVRHVAIMKDKQWMICVGHFDYEHAAASTHKQHGKKKQSSNHNQIRLYSLNNCRVVWSTVVYHEPSHITLSSVDETSVLISYDQLAPPQLWELSSQDADDAPHTPTASTVSSSRVPTLVLKHTFVCTPSGGRFARMPAAFGGPDESFVLRACAGRKARPVLDDAVRRRDQAPEKATTKDEPSRTPKRSWFSCLRSREKGNTTVPSPGQVDTAEAQEAADANAAVPWHIVCWDRQTAALLYHIDLPVEYGRLTSFAWRPHTSADPWMLVVGTIDGDVHVFTVDEVHLRESEKDAADSKLANLMQRVDTSTSVGPAPVAVTYAPSTRNSKVSVVSSTARPRLPYKQRSGSSATSPLSVYSYTSDRTLRDGDELNLSG